MEKVYVENDWYDGPRSGVADFDGVPHRFVAQFDELSGYLDTFTLFPICPAELALEIEQSNIFLDWNRRYKSGELAAETHPGYGEYSQR